MRNFAYSRRVQVSRDSQSRPIDTFMIGGPLNNKIRYQKLGNCGPITQFAQVILNRVNYFIAKFHLLRSFWREDMNIFVNSQVQLCLRGVNLNIFLLENYSTKKIQTFTKILPHIAQHIWIFWEKSSDPPVTRKKHFGWNDPMIHCATALWKISCPRSLWGSIVQSHNDSF